MAINTYTSQNTEYLWNTIIQQLPNPRGSSEQMAINFRSGGNDNYIYRNYLRSYYESGYALKTLLATSPGQCMIDLETGAMGSCELYRNVIDSNVIIGSARALYLTDSHDFTIRNNVLVGGASAAAPCGSTDNFTHNLLDGGTGLNCTPGANVNNIIYSSSQSSWFKNRSNYDFHLMPGAGAIDQVNPNALATIDMAGISRPFGPKADSGPYEMINDSQLPTAPNGLNATALSWSRIRLNWAPSTDNDAISHYNVYTYSAGSFIFFKSVPFTRFYDVGLPPNTLSRYKVSSVDRAGNESALSAEFSTTTSSGPVALVDTLAPGTPSQLTVN
jgi:parallel beta-helix repeat protein